MPGTGGGSPGEIGGLGSIAFVAPAAGDNPQGPGLDPAADALLHEILPSPVPPSERSSGPSRVRKPPAWAWFPAPGWAAAVVPAAGRAAASGRGIGPGTEFFGARENGVSFAYVIDCSGSMALRNSLVIAKRELLSSLNQLPPDARFSVVFYNEKPRVFTDPTGVQGLMAATASNKLRVQSQLQTVDPTAAPTT